LKIVAALAHFDSLTLSRSKFYNPPSVTRDKKRRKNTAKTGCFGSTIARSKDAIRGR
jgi:hypothetical protein